MQADSAAHVHRWVDKALLHEPSLKVCECGATMTDREYRDAPVAAIVDTCDECARANVGPCPHVAQGEPRGWVKRLGSYLFIFGGRGDAGQPEHRAYIDRLETLAKEREAEHGR